MVQSICMSDLTWQKLQLQIQECNFERVLHHDGCIMMDGVKGGSSEAIYPRWQIGADYDDCNAMALSFCRWLQIKTS